MTPACFFENDPSRALWRRAGAEGVGTALLLAAFALMLVVLAVARGAPRTTGPVAVGAWLFAATLVFPSGSLANPAVAIAAMAASGPLALTSGTALAAIAAEALGGLAALGIIASLGVRPAMVRP